MTNPADKLSLLMATPNEEPVSQYKGVVQQTDDSKAYVLIDGGTAVWCDTMDVKALVGDRVRVEVRKHKGTLVANYTHPVTDDAVANVANDKATEALDKVETLEVDALKADSAVIKNLQADTAKVHDLTADQLSAATAYVGELTAGEVTAQSIIADKAKLAQVDTDQLHADHAVIEALDSTYASIDNLNAATARIGNIEADYLVAADMTAEQARVGQLMAGKADVADLTAANARIDSLESTKADISVLESDYITADAIDATYLHADMSNADVAWIQNGVIKDGSISNAMINSLSANKLTAGTINGETINVTNINADNITAGTINGQRIGEGSLSLDKLSEDVYTEQEVDNKLSAMQAEIDGAIETWTGTDVPTLNNSPASGWNTSDERDRHVGDVYFVVNSNSQQNGYNYRFTKSGNTYSWQLIKDSDVTNALQRLSTAEGKITTFDSDISTLKTDTGTLKTKTESLETRMSDAEDDILDKVDTTTFNEVSDTVDQHSQTITQMSQTLSNKADGSTVTALTTRVSKTEQDITGINTTIGELSTTVESKADSSTVETVSNRLNTVSDTVDGHTQSITSINNTLETKADSSTVSTLTTKVNNVSDTVDGHTQTIGSVQTTQTQMQGKLDKTIVETTQLWYSKSSTDAPNKPTSQVTSTSTAGNAWRTVVPAYNASYPNYFYCYQWKYTDGTYGWSSVTRDIAMGESQERARTAITNAAAADTKAGNAATAAATAQSTAEGAASDASKAKTDAASAVSTANTAASDASTALSTANTAKINADTAVSTANTAASDASTAKTNAATAVSTANTAKATADKNVKSTLQLWYTKANDTAPAKPTSKVTSTSVSGNAWRTVVPTYSASYPYYFYCYQYELADGTYTWSDVVYDRATTENQSNSRSAVTGVSTLTNKTNTISDTVDGHTSQLSSITTTQTTIQGSAVKSTVQLWFTKANTTAPSKPTAHVTTNNASTANAWNLAVPTYNASYPYYYYCYEHQLLNDTYTWSAVTRDIATEESQSTSRSAASAAATADGKAVSAQNTANKNVKESQQLWYTKANSTAPAKPTSKVTSTATTGGAWTTRVPTYSEDYKHYFYCMQYVAADGTVTWSDVVYDQATTEAQSVARAASADLTEFHQEYATFKQTTQEFESTVGETYATKAALETTDGNVTNLTGRVSTAESSITQNTRDISLRVTKTEFESLEIGGRNLLTGTDRSTEIVHTVASGATHYTEGVSFTVPRVEGQSEYVLSFDAKSSVANYPAYCHWYAPNTTTKAVTSTGYEGTGADGACIVAIGTSWARYWVKWTQSDTAGTDKHLIVCRMQQANAGTLTIKAIKLETGNMPTAWSPAPEDLDAHFESVETAIEQNAEAIKLTATKEEVEKTYSTKEDSQLDRTGSGTSVTIEGAANAALKGLHVLGESVQDGTPTPDAPVPIVSVSGNLLGPLTAKSGTAGGVSYTISEDGTFTMSGTATGASYFTPVTGKTLPAGTYTLSVSNRSNYTEKSYPPEVKFGDASTVSPTLTRTFTSEWDISLCKVYVRNAQTYDSSFSVQLYVGHAAWIDSGYDGIGLRVVGKNLLPKYSAITINGIDCDVAADGVVTLNGTATATVNLQSYFLVPKTDTYTLSGCPSGGGASSIQLWTYDMTTWETIDGQITDVGSGGTRTLTGGHWIVVRLRVQNGYTCNNVVVRPQLELGSEATEYEPYSGTVTPIPLNGHELRSLPDGTHDELSVDADGRVTMVQRVGSVSMGEVTWASVSSSGVTYSEIADCETGVLNGPVNSVCSHYPTSSPTMSAVLKDGHACVQATFKRVLVKDSTHANLTGAQYADAVDGGRFTYPLATPQTIDLGTIVMPQVRDGDTVEVIAALTPSIDATWWSTSGQAVADAYASLSSAIEVKAESIVSTVSERYATSQEVRAISSQIEQTAQGWGIQFKNLLGTPADGQSTEGMTLANAFEQLGVTKGNLEQIRSYVRIAEETVDNKTYPVLLMGSSNSPIMLALSNKALEFRHGDEKVAYIDVNGDTQEGMLHITRAVVVKELQFGSWKWFERDGVGNLALKWVGDE